MHFDKIVPYIPYILGGISVILQLSLISAVVGCIIGLGCALIKQSKGKAARFFSKIIDAYIDFFRGTPVYVQLYFFHMGLPQITGILTSGYVSAFIVFSLNSGAYLAEIMRAGIEGIDKGQIEAAKALGVSQKDIIKDIILPQAIRNVLPALMNEFITLTKETSVVSVVGMSDMMRRFSIIQGSIWLSFEPLTIVMIAYYALNKILSFAGKCLERKLKYD